MKNAPNRIEHIGKVEDRRNLISRDSDRGKYRKQTAQSFQEEDRNCISIIHCTVAISIYRLLLRNIHISSKKILRKTKHFYNVCKIKWS